MAKSISIPDSIVAGEIIQQLRKNQIEHVVLTYPNKKANADSQVTQIVFKNKEKQLVKDIIIGYNNAHSTEDQKVIIINPNRIKGYRRYEHSFNACNGKRWLPKTK